MTPHGLQLPGTLLRVAETLWPPGLAPRSMAPSRLGNQAFEGLDIFITRGNEIPQGLPWSSQGGHNSVDEDSELYVQGQGDTVLCVIECVIHLTLRIKPG